MKTVDYLIRESVPQRIANTKGKYSNLFMSGEVKYEKASRITNLEEGIRMGGYDVNVRKPAKNRTDKQQPMAGYSEFWIS